VSARVRSASRYHPGEGEPWPFYQQFGLEPTGEIEEGEIVLRLNLSGGDANQGGRAADQAG
jgi:hypothetical protein